MSESKAPPADAQSFDFSKLVIADSSKPSSSSKQTSSSKIVESRKPSASTMRGLDSHRPSSVKVAASHKPSSSTMRIGDSQRPRASALRVGDTQRPRETKQAQSTLSTVAEDSRVPDPKSPIGDMNRTFISGQILKTEFDTSADQKSYAANTLIAGRSMAPPTARSVLINPEDIKMASRQTQYKSLAPSEQAKQERWAQTIIGRIGSCPEGFDWARIDDGYHCFGGHHVISDELLREGRGGVFGVEDKTNPYDRLGPYYQSDPGHPQDWIYGGPQPKPVRAPQYMMTTVPTDPAEAARIKRGELAARLMLNSQHAANLVNGSRAGNSYAQGLASQRRGTGYPRGSQYGGPSSRY